MDTTSMSHGVVHDKDGIIAGFTCNGCRTQITLALSNGDVGNSQLTARINWVDRYVPYEPTASDKLTNCSLTGYSKKLKQHAEKYDLWDVAIGSKADVSFNPKEYATKMDEHDIDDGRDRRVKYVAIVPYGSEGSIPLNCTSCRMFRETGDNISCESGSGGSICGYFAGYASNDVVKCEQEDK